MQSAESSEENGRVRRTTEVIHSAGTTLQLLIARAVDDGILPRGFRVEADAESQGITITCTGNVKVCVDAANVLQAKGCACSSIEGGTACDCPTPREP